MLENVTVTFTYDEAKALYNKAVNGHTTMLPRDSEETFADRVEAGRSGMRKLGRALIEAGE